MVKQGEINVDGKINYAEVLIDKKVYTVGGTEDTEYFQKIAAYINLKLRDLRNQSGFSKQSEDYQQVMLAINMADDYFKTQDMAELLQRQKEETEREIYSIKHDLIHTQMKLEEAQLRIQELEAALHISPVSADEKKEEIIASVPDAEEEEKKEEVQEIKEEEQQEEESKRLAKEEEEKQKALEAAKIATEQLLKSRPLQNLGRQTKR